MKTRHIAIAVALACCQVACETDAVGVEATAQSLYDGYFNKCASCHADGAAGKTSQTEQNLDFGSVEAMKKSVLLKASGLVGNQSGCNDVPFIEAGNANGSLLVAVVDESARQSFDNSKYPNCDSTAISAMENRVGGAPSAEVLTALKQWINDGGTN